MSMELPFQSSSWLLLVVLQCQLGALATGTSGSGELRSAVGSHTKDEVENGPDIF